MTAEFAPTSFVDADRLRQDQALKNRRFGLFLWRIANGGVFVFFIFANYLMRSVQPSWPPPGVARLDAALPTVLAALLLLSAIPAGRALASIRRSDVLSMKRHILATVALGIAFVAGMIAVCLQIPYSGPYSSIVMTMNGFHILHAIAGMLLFAVVFRRAGQGAYSKDEFWGVEASVVFWHFVDLMWVFFFAVLYVL